MSQFTHLTPAEHYVEAEKCLFHAAAAETGSYAEDINLRFALVHATLASAHMAYVHAMQDEETQP